MSSKPNFIKQFCQDQQDKFNRKVLKKFSTPWMKRKEYDIIFEVFQNLQPKRVLEWGSGYSTVLIPDQLANLEDWVSIEHNEEWFHLIKQKIENDKVHLHFVAPNNLEFEKSADPKVKEGIFEDFRDYVEFPVQLDGEPFDFIFIDGRARRDCLIKAHQLLSKNGVLIVHDANRDTYFEDIPPFKTVFHLQDYRKHRKLGGIWVATQRENLDGILATTDHKRAWKGHDGLAKWLFLK